MTQNRNPKKPLLKRNWLVIASLVIFPPLGIILAWLTEWPKKNKILATGLSGLWLLIASVTNQSDIPETRETASPNPRQELQRDEEHSSIDPRDNIGNISSGMTFDEVVELLGVEPDTVADDSIRQSLGEMATGDVTYYWRNPDPNCFPVAVSFFPGEDSVAGWDEGRVCVEEELEEYAEPFGESFVKPIH